MVLWTPFMDTLKGHCSSHWQIFVEQLFRLTTKKNINVSHYFPFVRRSFGGFPSHKGQKMAKVFPCHNVIMERRSRSWLWEALMFKLPCVCFSNHQSADRSAQLHALHLIYWNICRDITPHSLYIGEPATRKWCNSSVGTEAIDYVIEHIGA